MATTSQVLRSASPPAQEDRSIQKKTPEVAESRPDCRLNVCRSRTESGP